METRRQVSARRSRLARALSALQASLFFLFTGCGAPGEPLPPRPPIPAAISDLVARQRGTAIILTFSVPRKTINGETLAEPPAIEIYRGFLPPGVSPKTIQTRLVYAIPSALVSGYLIEGSFEFIDSIETAELRAHAGEQISYVVRTRASERRASVDSNTVIVQMRPVAESISDVRATATERAVEISWSAPAPTSPGATLPIAGYHVYRAEVDPGFAASQQQDLAKIKLKTPLQLLATATGTTFQDTKIEFDRNYLYSVRSFSSGDSTIVESADSKPVIITPRDVFPPAAPQNVIAVFVPALAGSPAHVELSWAISRETDLGGYRIYRSEQEGVRGGRLNSDLLLAPVFRDMSVVAGKRYIYQATAEDRAGNESILSAPVSIDIPQRAP